MSQRAAIAWAKWGSLGAIAIALPLWTTPAQASDHLNLEEGLPLEVEDAYPVPYQGIELQGSFRYERTGAGKDVFLLEPRLEYGFAPNWQAKVKVPFELGSAVEDGIGDVGIEVFYNFNTETLTLPAISLSVGADFPTGPDSNGVDPTVKLILTKTLGKRATNLDRLHLNLAYSLNGDRQRGERDDRFAAVLGYSRRVGPETIFLADFVYEQERERYTDIYLVEVGVRHQLSPLNVLSVGAGVGIGKDSPDFRLTIGFQQSL